MENMNFEELSTFVASSGFVDAMVSMMRRIVDLINATMKCKDDACRPPINSRVSSTFLVCK